MVKIDEFVVGRGYDTLNCPYLNGEKLKKRILKPVDVEVSQSMVLKDHTDNFKGLTSKSFISSFKKNRGASIPIESMGTIEFKENFESDIKKEKIDSYGQINSYVRSFKEHIELTQEEMKKLLTDGFRKSINDPKCEPKTLFNDYGTHLLQSAIIGGRLSINITYHRDIFETKNTFEQSFNIAAKELFKGESGTSFSAETKQLLENSQFTFESVGGKDGIKLDIYKIAESYSIWRESMDKRENLVLCDISDPSDLIPVWVFCDDEVRQVELEAYYNAKVKENRKALLLYESYVSDIKILSASTAKKAKQQCENGYVLIDKDLSKGAGGFYTYISYKLVTDNEIEEDSLKIYTDLKAEDNPKPNKNDIVSINGHNYKRFQPSIKDRGLNRHLIGTTEKWKGNDKRIQRIDVIYDDHTKTDADLVRFLKPNEVADMNKNCPGKSVYIGMYKES